MSIRTSIELTDNFSNTFAKILSAVDSGIYAVDRLNNALGAPINTIGLQNATAAAQNLQNNLDNIVAPDIAPVQIDVIPNLLNAEPPQIPPETLDIILNIPDEIDIPQPNPLEVGVSPDFEGFDAVPQIEPVSIPIHWQTDDSPVFTNTGVERFELEVQNANEQIEKLIATQNAISANAANVHLFPDSMKGDLNNVGARIDAIKAQIAKITANPMNVGGDIANAEIERLRGSLGQAIKEQTVLNDAVKRMDIPAANAAYLQLSGTIANTERYIRDNTDGQGRFKREVQETTDAASDLKSMIMGAAGAYLGFTGIQKALNFVQDCEKAFNTQVNSEIQLLSVLRNNLTQDYIASFELDVTADTTAAVDAINAIQDGVNPVELKVQASRKALQAAFDQITTKASKIQGRGIYGDEAMIAAGAEFATYMSDTDAITKMMDTLANYTMGMTGGGEVGKEQMVQYATGLGKVLNGAYDAMTKKGFEFDDIQKKIIDGTATEAELVTALGADYANMSADMQKAEIIAQVINQSWAGLYEQMSNTPEGKIIQMNNALGDMREVIGKELYPFSLMFVDAINDNWSTIETIVGGITTGLKWLVGMLGAAAKIGVGTARVISNNWDLIAPIVYAVSAALAVYAAQLVVTKTLQMASAVASGVMAVKEGLHAAAIVATTGATWAETAAQMGLNAAMYACPLTWIVGLIFAVVAAFYIAVAAVNHFADTSISATGIIAGAFNVLGAYIYNVFAFVMNTASAVAAFLSTVFNDPLAATYNLFADIWNGIIDLVGQAVAEVIKLIGKIPGLDKVINIDTNFNVDDFKIDRMSIPGVEDPRHVQAMNYSEAAQKGYEWGANLSLNPNDIFGIEDVPAVRDMVNSMDRIGNAADGINGNTSDMKKSLELKDEDLKYLRDLAEQEVINRYTTAQVNVDMSNMKNSVSGTDLGGFVTALTDAVSEGIDIITEGVHT